MVTWKGALYLTLASSIWGGMYVVSKIVLQEIPPWVLLEIRFIIALVVLGSWAFFAKQWRVKATDLWMISIIGLIGFTGSIGLQFIGTSKSGAALGSLITSASPALISLFAWIILKEKLTFWKNTSLLLATIGVLVVIGLPSTSTGTFEGNIILIGAAITWALYTVLSRVQTQTYSSLTVTTWATFFGVLFTSPLALWEYLSLEVQLPTNLWIWSGVLYIGVISTAVAFYLWNKGFEYINPVTGSLFFFFQPLVGSLLGALILAENLGWNFMMGALLIGIGIYLTTRDTDRKNNLLKVSCSE